MKLCLLLLCMYGSVVLSKAQDIHARKFNAVLTSPPKAVPTTKTPDGALAGNGDIGLTLGGSPDQLTFYIGKNDFWRAYPVYPGGGIAHPGGLTVLIADLIDGSYRAEQVIDKALINGRFEKNDLQVKLNTLVAATKNMVVSEFKTNKTCGMNIRLWP